MSVISDLRVHEAIHGTVQEDFTYPQVRWHLLNHQAFAEYVLLDLHRGFSPAASGYYILFQVFCF